MSRPQVVVTVVEITSQTVQLHDVITIGGQAFEISDLILPGRAKRLRFGTGETFTMHANTTLSATRAAGRR
ncbi:hypothetical protein ACIRRI_34220 [Streptomyces mirabilis]|uniref:hypothetical protein n=1 Tax=Streptomyces mirabilis TaxID=68239 RepID=UPI00380B9E30